MKLHRAVAFFIALALIFLTSCVKDDDLTNSETNNIDYNKKNNIGGSAPTFSLMYCSNDTLDPYTAVTKINQELTVLMFDPLVKLDRDFSPIYVLADKITLNGTNCVITLKSVNFSDGSTLNAEDVTYSIKKAKESQTKYRQQLENVVSYSAASANTVSLKLNAYDPYFINLLDFPIIKRNSDTRKSADNVALPPIGCGRYIFDTDNKQLSANSSYHNGGVSIKHINLINTPDGEALRHNIEVGSISMYYTDLSDNTLPKMTGKIHEVPLNNLVFIGVNSKNKHLNRTQLRQAISSAINRSVICEKIYLGNATPAQGPFNSEWKDASGLQTIDIKHNIDICVANLGQIGYNNKDNDGYFIDNKGKRLSFTLLCNNDNSSRLSLANLLSQQLKDAGIELKVKAVDWNSYINALNSGSFDLYLGEIKLLNNMDITQLVTPGGNAAFGISEQEVRTETTQNTSSDNQSEDDTPDGTDFSFEPTYKILQSFYEGSATLQQVIIKFLEELPVIPVCHRCGLVTYNQRLNPGPKSTLSDIFLGIEDCLMN